ncbi:hypothetical protein CPB83DRAFT_889878 [Crepidotus variabilis]|uniref:GDS1 winged helix domain-containing protein n=1 Tax=Crepidotus variabilis TaxID=179855 RepID=A0A9P6EQS9_9AGAR|nr:hypothetical protein CPB83DRAFT_889878 [Crepidotus variabilis]
MHNPIIHHTFPPPNVVLHPDDATNKTFIAVAKAFLSVDNRAMTIKDIAKMVGQFGLVCQNTSAAAQSITTYLRQHKTRCDQQDDQPLLLSHALSGTQADDELVPALHSRSGGDSHPLANDRLTNFRKGTAVWYLSRATGAPCPFARAGIRLCDFACPEDDPIQKPVFRRKRQMEQEETVCGQKRKRPLRGCAAQREDGDASDVEERPPKVKLTLRLKPLLINRTQTTAPSPGSSSVVNGFTAPHPIDVPQEDEDLCDSADDENESMSVDSSDEDESEQSLAAATHPNQPQEEEPWCLPPYPRRSISIPCYTPSVESYYSTFTLPPSNYRDPFRRSPSLPYSVGSPPPESEDESDDFQHAIEGSAQNYQSEEELDMGWDADLDSEEDGETMWESPGPRSPSAPLVYPPSDIAVKEEPRDLQGLLDAWEDYDSSIAGSRAVEVLAKALDTADDHKVKIEATDPWDWDAQNTGWVSEEPRIKQEDLGFDSFLAGPSSPLSPISSLASQFSSFNWSDASSPPQASDEDIKNFGTVRPRSKTMPTPFSSTQESPPQILRYSVSSGSSQSSSREPSVPSTNLATLIQSMSVNTSVPPVAILPPQPCVAPFQTRCQPVDSHNAAAEKVVVHTCQPCNPAITAVHMEDIPVFQMMLGAFQLLRRIDSDFVNLSPIVAYSGTAGVTQAQGNSGSRPSGNTKSSSTPSSLASAIPPSTPSNVVTNATVITSGSSEICGTWVSLSTAQVYVRNHLAGESARALEVFLSDTLFALFPTALQDFHRENADLRALNRFGRHFGSTLMVSGVVDYANGQPQQPSVNLKVEPVETTLIAGVNAILPTPSFVLGLGHLQEDGDAPLSKTEQDLFHELCNIPHDEIPTEEVTMMENLQLELPQTPITARPPIKGHSKSSSMSSMSSLSSDDETLVQSTSTILHIASSSSTQPRPSVVPAPGPIDNRPLRRSKRVADALAATHTPQPAQTSRSSRSRKGGSRNSLS